MSEDFFPQCLYITCHEDPDGGNFYVAHTDVNDIPEDDEGEYVAVFTFSSLNTLAVSKSLQEVI